MLITLQQNSIKVEGLSQKMMLKICLVLIWTNKKKLSFQVFKIEILTFYLGTLLIKFINHLI